MIRPIICKECKEVRDREYICDQCGKTMSYPIIEVTYGYGHSCEGETIHFCDDDCMILYLKNEQKKHKPKDNRFVYGDK